MKSPDTVINSTFYADTRNNGSRFGLGDFFASRVVANEKRRLDISEILLSLLMQISLS
jgi:hypothetical protein